MVTVPAPMVRLLIIIITIIIIIIIVIVIIIPYIRHKLINVYFW